MFYLQTSTLPPRMHHKLTKHGRFCKQNNQLPTETHVELKDNSNINHLIFEVNNMKGKPVQQDIKEVQNVDFLE
jgi:hypothetical protein